MAPASKRITSNGPSSGLYSPRASSRSYFGVRGAHLLRLATGGLIERLEVAIGMPRKPRSQIAEMPGLFQ